MTIESGRGRSAARPIAPWAALVLAAGIAALAAAAACTVDASAREFAAKAAVDDSVNASAVLAAVRGQSPLACSFTARALENRWGRSHRLGGPDAAALDDAQAAAFDWAMSVRDTRNALPVLRRALSDADPCVRRTAAQLVGRMGGPDLANELRSELTGPDATRRETAVLALGYSADSANEPALARAASDAEPRVRRTVAWALGRTRNGDAATTLLRMLRDADPLVRVNAALSLGALSAGPAVEPLIGLLASDGDARVRRAAAAALGQIDNSRNKS